MHAAHAQPGFLIYPRSASHGSCGGWRHMTGHRGRRGWGGGFPGGGSGRGPRARRGDVRAAILALLAEEPRNGYQIMQELSERSGGAWRPSPGSIYPALQQLEDEGLVTVEEVEGRKAYSLTDAGKEEVASRTDEQAPWDAVSASAGDGVNELRDLAWQLGAAVMQVAHTGNKAQLDEAKKILNDARKAVYKILAADE
jgi:DNA-binding PadR family transcriptional regulator